MVPEPRDPASRRLHLNGATIMSTPSLRHVEIARAAGFAGVELRAERLVGASEELRAISGFVRPGEVWSLNGIQIKIEPNGALRRDLLEDDLPPRLEICRAVGAAYLLVVPPRIAGIGPDSAMPGIVDGLSLIRDAAARDGIHVAFEFLGFGDCPIDSPSLAARVASSVAGADLVIDSCHWHASGSDSLGGFPIERLAMVHLNDAPAKPPRAIEDADRLLPGLGVIRLPDLVDDLVRAGYAGPWSLETFNPAYWRLDPMDVARAGFSSTRNLLAPSIGN